MAEEKTGKSKIKPMHIALIAIVLIVIVAVVYMTTSAAGQVVANGDNVSVIYTGKLTNGTVFDSNVGKQLLTFTVGSSQIIQGFSLAVIGMKVNQTKNVTIPANQAYGQPNPSLIVVVPRSQFGNTSVAVGLQVQTNSGQRGVITSDTLTNVTVNFNPPLAGQTLLFQIKMVAIHKKQ